MNTSKAAATKLTIKFTILQSAFWASFSAIWGFAVVYLLYKGFLNTQIGIVLSLAAIASIFLQPLIASFIDKHPTIPLKIILSLLIFILLLLALTLFFIPNQNVIIGSIYVLIGSILLSLPPLTYSLALEYINRGSSINFGVARGLGSLSFAIMSYFIGIAIENFHPTIIIPIFIITCILMIIIISTFKAPSTYDNSSLIAKQTNSQCSSDVQPQTILLFFKNNPSFFILLTGFTMLFISHNFINTYHINIIKSVGGNDADMGLSVGLAAAAELPIMAGFAYLVSRIKCSNLLKISALFFFIKSVIIFLAPNVFVVLISQSLQMFSYALFTLASIYYVNDIMDESNKTKGQALIGAATMGIGGSLGNYIGGKVIDHYSVNTMLLIGIMTSLAGFIIIMISTKNSTS